MLCDKYVRLHSIDHNNILNTTLVLSWVGFPGWESLMTIRDMVETNDFTLINIHNIIHLIKRYQGQPYTCGETLTYMIPDKDFVPCPGWRTCPFYHEQDMERQLQLLTQLAVSQGFS